MLGILLALGRALAAEPSAPPAAGAPAADGEGPSLDALVARAHLGAVKQDWTHAEALFREALDKDADRADAWRGLGYVLRKQGHAEDARAAYEKALELAPADSETLLGLGETYVALGRASDATALLERLRTVDKRNAATLDWIIRTGKPR
jgi:Flp pilus assembly protein TadD